MGESLVLARARSIETRGISVPGGAQSCPRMFGPVAKLLWPRKPRLKLPASPTFRSARQNTGWLANVSHPAPRSWRYSNGCNGRVSNNLQIAPT